MRAMGVQSSENTSKSVCLMSMQLNLMAQIFQGEHRKDMKYSCKIKDVHVRKKNKVSPLLNHEVKIAKIRPIIVSVIPLDIANVFHKVLKSHSSLLKSELHFSVLVSSASQTSLRGESIY